MLIEVIKPFVPYLGKKGTRRQVPKKEGEIHVYIGNAVEVDETIEPQVTPKPKRKYKRRDLRAEQ